MTTPDEPAVLHHREPVVAGVVDEPGRLRHAGVRARPCRDRVVIMSDAFEANALRSRSSKRPSGSRKTVPAEEVDVVGQVQVALVVGQHEVGLGDDARRRRPSPSTTGTPGSSCSRSGADDVLDRACPAPPSPASASMMSRTSSGHRPRTLPDAVEAPRAAPRSRRRPSRGRRRRRSAAARAARPWASAPRAAASNAARPLASRAPIRPESTSPVPAVASAGLPPGLTASGPPGRGDDRVVALEQHHGPAALGRLARAGEPRGVRSRRGRARAAGRARPRAASARWAPSRSAKQLERAGVRVQPVGVHQQRRLHRGARPRGRTRARPPRGRGPGPSTTAPGALGHLRHHRRRPPACGRRPRRAAPRLICSSSRSSTACCAGAGTATCT